MSWFILGLLAVAFIFFGMGWVATHTARSDDEGIIGGVFYLVSVLLLVSDGVLAIAVAIILALT